VAALVAPEVAVAVVLRLQPMLETADLMVVPQQ
jgi:hypothetical protein